jgi:hypothetical protein
METSLEPEVVAAINEPGVWAVLASVGDSGFPSAIPVGSLVAPDTRTLRCALRETARTLANIRVRPQVGVTVFAGHRRLALSGRASAGGEVPPGHAYFGVACWAVTIDRLEVRPLRAVLNTLPLLYWTWDPAHAAAITAIRHYLLGRSG